MKGFIALSLATALVAPATALAATPAAPSSASANSETLAAANRLVDLMQLDRVMDGMFGDLKGLFADNVIAALERDQTQASYLKTLFENGRGGREKFASILGEEFRAAMQSKYPAMKSVAAAEYSKLFALQELNELAAFFSSGVGAKWQAISPQIEQSVGQWGERAGMEAGSAALVNALKRADSEMLAKGNSQ